MKERFLARSAFLLWGFTYCAQWLSHLWSVPSQEIGSYSRWESPGKSPYIQSPVGKPRGWEHERNWGRTKDSEGRENIRREQEDKAEARKPCSARRQLSFHFSLPRGPKHYGSVKVDNFDKSDWFKLTTRFSVSFCRWLFHQENHDLRPFAACCWLPVVALHIINFSLGGRTRIATNLR